MLPKRQGIKVQNCQEGAFTWHELHAKQPAAPRGAPLRVSSARYPSCVHVRLPRVLPRAPLPGVPGTGRGSAPRPALPGFVRGAAGGGGGEQAPLK